MQSTHLGPIISGAINEIICQPQSLETAESKPKTGQKSPVPWPGRQYNSGCLFLAGMLLSTVVTLAQGEISFHLTNQPRTWFREHHPPTATCSRLTLEAAGSNKLLALL